MSEIAENIRQISIATPSLGEEEWHALKEPLLSGWITQGPKVAEFERSFSQLHNLNHSLAVTSCTTGLHLALVAMGIGPGDEVIVPAFTWVATANVVLYCGATPIFCDVDTSTYNIDLNQIIDKITERTKAIIPVHLFGLCSDIEAIKSIIPSHIKVLEDAACAAGAVIRGKHAGSLGDMASFSFHPRKSITCGEGGVVTTNNVSLFEVAEKLRNHGAEIAEEVRHLGPRPYVLPDFKMLGYNYRMTDLQAAIGVVQLNKLEFFIQERQKWAEYYAEQLQSVEWLSPQEVAANITQHAWQAYVCYVDPQKAPKARNCIMDLLKKKGIATRPGTHAVHMLSFYKDKYNIKPTDFPGAKACDENTMAIPLHNRMTKADYDYIISTIKDI